jgi:hypothetical protein
VQATTIRLPSSDQADLALSLVSAVGLAVVTALLLIDPAASRGAPTALSKAEVARLTFALSGVRRRSEQTLVWDDLRVGDALHEGDSMFVSPGASASIVFADGSKVEVDENSLIVIERPVVSSASQPSAVALIKGSLSGNASSNGVEIRSQAGVAALAGGSEARVSVSAGERTEFQVFSGSARLKTAAASATLGANEAATTAPGGELTREVSHPFRLEAPSRDARLFFVDVPAPVDLRWAKAGSADVLQISSARDFQALVKTTPAASGEMRFVPPRAGIYWWRVLGAGGEVRSEERKFAVVADRPPTAIGPAPQEIVYAPPGTGIPFSWSPVAGVSQYQLELASDARFAQIVHSQRSEAPGLWIHHDLPEGTYAWRVRSVDAERGESPYSKSVSFRLIVKPLPQAPELLDSEIEVDAPQPKP